MASSRIELDEQFQVPLPVDELWALMTEPETVVAFIPGAELTGVRENGEYEGSVTQKLGPTRVRFHGVVAVEFDHAAHVGSLRARGGDGKGRTRAVATTTFRLAEPDGPASSGTATQVSTEAVIEMSGALAPFLSTGGTHLARRVLEQFAANVTQHAAETSRTREDEA